MKRVVICVLGAFAISGCASMNTPVDTSKIAPAPQCHSDEQCGRMWAAAHTQLEKITTMKLQSASDDYIETYNDTQFGGVSGSVSKIKTSDGYTFQANFECAGFCGANRVTATDKFNKAVGAIK